MMPPRLRHLGAGRPASRCGKAGPAGPLMVVLIAALLGVACGKTPSAQPSDSPRPSTPARVAIVSPSGGSTVTSTVHVVLTLAGATLAPSTTNKGADPTTGHIHLSLDGSIVSMTSSLTQDVDVQKPGTHILTAEFVANDHGSFFPRQFQTISFTSQ